MDKNFVHPVHNRESPGKRQKRANVLRMRNALRCIRLFARRPLHYLAPAFLFSFLLSPILFACHTRPLSTSNAVSHPWS